MKAHHILNAASNLLGVALLITTAIHVTGRATRTLTDEFAFLSAVLLLFTCIASHRAITKEDAKWETVADRTFLTAQFVLAFAVLSLWL